MALSMQSDLLFYLSHLYTIPTVVLYFFLFYVLYFSREKVNFSSEFYKICAIQDVAGLIHIMVFYVTRKLPMSPSVSPILQYLPQSGLFPMLFQFSILYSASVLTLGGAVGCLNRASTVFLGAKHEILWTRLMKYVYIFLLVTPLAFTWNMVFNVVNISYIPLQAGSVITWRIETPPWASWMNSSQCILYCAIICDIWSFVWSMYTLGVIVKRNYLRATAQSRINSKRVQMFAFSLYVFVLRSTVTGLAVCSKRVALNLTFEIILYFLIDILQFSVPWMFFAFQGNVRKAVKNILLGKSKTTVSSSCSKMFTNVNSKK